MGITWGVWVSQRAQNRALAVCTVFGIALAAVGLGALGGMRDYGYGEGYDEALEIENRMYQQKIDAAEITPAPHKRSSP
jgi:succinate dehydrogenase / fumarate reductase cytochrome b subunit